MHHFFLISKKSVEGTIGESGLLKEVKMWEKLREAKEFGFMATKIYFP